MVAGHYHHVGPQGHQLGQQLHRVVGHPGAGGSVGWADPANGLALGFAKTLLVSPVDRWKATDVLVSAKVREVLGIR